jgi:spore coat protein A
MKKKKVLQSGIAALTLLCAAIAGSVSASTLVPQTALPGACIPQFAVPLPVFGPAGPIARVNAENHPALTVTMKEIDQAVLPQGVSDSCGMGVTFGKTRVWTYETTDSFTKKVLGPGNWPAVTVETQRYKPTLVTYVNALPSFNPANPTGPGMVQGLVSVDKTLMWADPLNSPMMNPCLDNPNPLAGCNAPYTGKPPAVVHLHGSEISSLYDGGPEAWMTPDGKTGTGYYTLYNAGAGKAVYHYQNKQEPGTLWFHDHAMGATRTNVYSGMAAYYFLRDAKNEPAKLPAGAYEIEMAIQDRQFDTKSQLFFPDGSPSGGVVCGSGDPGDACLNGAPGNPLLHPFWIPEFFGDVAIVNGAPWPYFNVEARRYRLRLLDGSNARFYNLNFGAAKVYAIGSDGNYLDKPALLSRVFMAPGERYDVIVDFTGLANTTVTVTNDATGPYPAGLSPVPYPDAVLCAATGGICPADQPTMFNIMQFRVSATLPANDKSCNPAVAGQCVRPSKMVALTDGLGNLAAGVKIDKKRQLTLKEYEDPTTLMPREVLVNNTKFDGRLSPSINAEFSLDGVSELPQQGSTELWEIINLTIDAHPIHTHLTQFQVVNRESFNTITYPAAWAAAFGSDPAAPLPAGCTAGTFCPAYGPPLSYKTLNADGALGGNPAITPYLLNDKKAPAPEEAGWKDTAKILPGQVLRFVVRYTPSTAPLVANSTYAGKNLYPFDPTAGDGYVWHCHIIDHEDNEMMRPFRVVK